MATTVKRTLRSAGFNYDRDAVSRQTAIFKERKANPVIQSAKDETDINVMMKKFGVTGHFKPPAKLPQYGDYNGVQDFHTAMNVIRQAEEGFMELPSDIRFKFGNDPQQYLDFVTDPANKEELVKMGLAKKVPPVNNRLAPDPGVSSGKSNVDDKGSVASGANQDAKASGGAKGSGGLKQGES